MAKRIDWPALQTAGDRVDAYEQEADVSSRSQAHCAYNQTRECFLGLEVTAAEFSYAGLEDRLAERGLNSGEGLWLVPFHGIPTTGLYAQMDLIYLDDECRVIEVVESYPTFLANPSRPQATSVLVLPAHSIYSSQTQAGDQLVLCVAGEMGERLERLSAARDDFGTVQGAVLLREQPLWSGGAGRMEFEGPAMDEGGMMPQPHEMSLIEPGIKAVRPPKNWLERWWSPDPRNAPRDSSPGLAAYYWNGAPPKAHTVRDVSATGFYLETEERWYPGTLVLMMLRRTNIGEEVAERSISVMSRAVRWGNDGVGLQFVLPEDQNLRKEMKMNLDGANKKELRRFLQQLMSRNG
jgi:hypothetical protein